MNLSKKLLTSTKVAAAFAVAVGTMPAAFTSVAAANPACVAGAQGCVLPVTDAPAPVATTTTTPVYDVEEPKSFGILPILAGLAAVGLLAWLLLDDDDDEELPISP